MCKKNDVFFGESCKKMSFNLVFDNMPSDAL